MRLLLLRSSNCTDRRAGNSPRSRGERRSPTPESTAWFAQFLAGLASWSASCSTSCAERGQLKIDPVKTDSFEGVLKASKRGLERRRLYCSRAAGFSGEMTPVEFTEFLRLTLGNAAAVAKDGAIGFVCMDWRHLRELLAAGESVFSELKNLCVWNKSNGGMGSFYRSKHELVFKVGTAPHTNSFGLGETGRYRTNVWDYAGISSVGAKRMEELAMHPTVKPTALVADAIKDCSRRGEVVLDVFCWLGNDHHSRRAEWAYRSGARVRSRILRHDRYALAGLHRQAGNPGF